MCALSPILQNVAMGAGQPGGAQTLRDRVDGPRKAFRRRPAVIGEFPHGDGGTGVAIGRERTVPEGAMEVLLGFALLMVIVDALRIVWRGPIAPR